MSLPFDMVGYEYELIFLQFVQLVLKLFELFLFVGELFFLARGTVIFPFFFDFFVDRVKDFVSRKNNDKTCGKSKNSSD